MEEKATLKILPVTRDELRALKRGGESYDAVIRRLMEYHDQGVSAASSLLKPILDESKKEAEG